MSYANFIASVMTAFTYGLEIGVMILNQFLELDENGFYFTKENNKLYLDLLSVINVFLQPPTNNEEEWVPQVVKMRSFLMASDIKNLPSYIEIVNLIESIRKQNLNRGSNVIGFNYGHLKTLLSKVKTDGNNGFIKELIGFANLGCEEIGNIALTNPVFACKLEKMYQLERLLVGYCKMHIAKHVICDKNGYDYRTDQLGLLDKINLADYEVDWQSFYNIIDSSNSIEMEFAKNSRKYGSKKKVIDNRILGLPDMNDERYLLLLSKEMIK